MRLAQDAAAADAAAWASPIRATPGRLIAAPRDRFGLCRARTGALSLSWCFLQSLGCSAALADLHFLGGIATREQRQPVERPDDEQIDEAEEHERRG